MDYRARERQRKSDRPAKLNEKKGDRDLEREIENKRDIFFVGGTTSTLKFCSRGDNANGHQCQEKMVSSEKNVNKNTYDIASIKKFLEVSRCSRAKQRQRNVQKTCAACAKLLFC